MIRKVASVCLMASLMTIVEPASARTSLLILGFELVDEMQDPRTVAADQRRLDRVTEKLKSLLQSCPAFNVTTDVERAAQEIAVARSRVAYLHRCNGCAAKIGRAAGVELVLLPWVQKVSNLILNLNAEVRDVVTDRVVAARSVDIRGNTDRAWLRGVSALAGRVCELDGERLNREVEN